MNVSVSHHDLHRITFLVRYHSGAIPASVFFIFCFSCVTVNYLNTIGINSGRFLLSPASVSIFPQINQSKFDDKFAINSAPRCFSSLSCFFFFLVQQVLDIFVASIISVCESLVGKRGPCGGREDGWEEEDMSTILAVCSSE